MSEFDKLLTLTSSIPVFFVLIAIVSGVKIKSVNQRVNRIISSLVDSLKLSLMLILLGCMVHQLNPLIWGPLMIFDWILIQKDESIVRGLNRTILFVKDWLAKDYTYAKKQMKQNK